MQEMSESAGGKADERQALDGADAQLELDYLLCGVGKDLPSLGLHCPACETGGQ